jgi:anaerobic selenocysteine-containing dehydrogenase
MSRKIARLMKAAKKSPLPAEELLAEEKRLMEFGARQAKRLGIREGDIVRIIHASRARRAAASGRTGM